MTKNKIAKQNLFIKIVFLLLLINIGIITSFSTKAFSVGLIYNQQNDNDFLINQDDLSTDSTFRPLPNKRYIEYSVMDFINDSKTDDLVDISVLFQDNVIWNFSGLQLNYKYKYFNGFKASIPSALFKLLQEQSFVKFIEEEPTYNLNLTTNDDLSWGLNRLDAEKVWGGENGALDVIAGNPTGEGVKVALIDSGIDYYHSDINANYKGGRDFAPINNTYPYYDNDPIFEYGTMDPFHGHFMSGLIAAEDNGEDMIGIAPEASIYALKIYGKEWSSALGSYVQYCRTNYDVAIEWAIENEIDIINMSFAGDYPSYLVEQVLDLAYKKGITLIAASGNDVNGNSYDYYPAAFPSVIQIGSTGYANGLATDCNYGDNQDFVAPGGTTLIPIKGLNLTEGTCLHKGSSLAAAHASGVCALMHDVAPNIMPQEVYYILKESAIDSGASGWDQYYGWGRIHAEDAVFALTDSTDSDSDGLINILETNIWNTDPYDSDSDNDGLNDTAEVRIYHSNPLVVDTDRDSLDDYDEVTEYLTDPIDEDSDNDGYHDQIEVLLDYDPLDNTQHPPQSFFLEYGDGEDYAWSASDSPYNAVYENATYEGEYYFVSSIEETTHGGYGMYAETTALDLDDWDGTSDLKLTFRFRCRSNYSSSSVTQFRLKFYDDDTSSYLVYDNPTVYNYYYVRQSTRNGQTWIDGKDSGWQCESFSLLASEFDDFAETDDRLFIEWGFHDSWSALWDQTTYLDFLLISEDDNVVVPNQPRELDGFGDEVSSIALVWKSPTNILAEEYIIERKEGASYVEQDTIEHDGTINSVQYWADPDTLSTGVTYYYRVCAVQNDIEGAYSYWSGKVDSFGLSNPIDLVASLDIDSSSQNGYPLLVALSIISTLGIGQIITRFRQSFVL